MITTNRILLFCKFEILLSIITSNLPDAFIGIALLILNTDSYVLLKMSTTFEIGHIEEILKRLIII